MDILGIYLPLNMSSVIVYFINTIIAFLVIVFIDKIIAHNIEGKKALVLSLLSFFVAPIIAPFIGMAGIYASLLLPLIIWIGFGELILDADAITKLKVLAIAFAVYYIMSIVAAPYLYAIFLVTLSF